MMEQIVGPSSVVSAGGDAVCTAKVRVPDRVEPAILVNPLVSV